MGSPVEADGEVGRRTVRSAPCLGHRPQPLQQPRPQPFWKAGGEPRLLPHPPPDHEFQREASRDRFQIDGLGPAGEGVAEDGLGQARGGVGPEGGLDDRPGRLGARSGSGRGSGMS